MNEHLGCTGETGHSHPRVVLSHESADFVVRRLFTAGLALGSCVRLLDRERAKHLTTVISELDDIGRDVRRAALQEGRHLYRMGGDPHHQALIASMSQVVAEITGRLESLGRSEVAEDLPHPHLLDAVQSLERALAYLRDGTHETVDPAVATDMVPAAEMALEGGRRVLHARAT